MARLSTLVKVVLALSLPMPMLASAHYNKEVTVVHSPDTRQCTFFMLSGVSEAAPVAPGDPWFAVPKSHAGYKEILAVLLLARTTGKALTHVATSGALACGHAAVISLSM
jgi:hypothetical protein